MQMRIGILKQNSLTLQDIQRVIETMEPLPGAGEFLSWLRSEVVPIILSDTYYEFALPLMKKLDFPTLFCNSIETNLENSITNYHLRIRDGKRKAAKAFREIGFRVIAMGDSYNDTTMLAEADLGILFRPPENVVQEFPQYRVFHDYDEVKAYIQDFLNE